MSEGQRAHLSGNVIMCPYKTNLTNFSLLKDSLGKAMVRSRMLDTQKEKKTHCEKHRSARSSSFSSCSSSSYYLLLFLFFKKYLLRKDSQKLICLFPQMTPLIPKRLLGQVAQAIEPLVPLQNPSHCQGSLSAHSLLCHLVNKLESFPNPGIYCLQSLRWPTRYHVSF